MTVHHHLDVPPAVRGIIAPGARAGMTPLRLGVVGCGAISILHHAVTTIEGGTSRV